MTTPPTSRHITDGNHPSSGVLWSAADDGERDRRQLAELVLLNGNPLLDIRNAAGIVAVATHGRLLRRADLDCLLSRAAQSAQDEK